MAALAVQTTTIFMYHYRMNQKLDIDELYEKGRCLLSEGENFEAVRTLLKSAIRGHLESQFLIGEIQTSDEWVELYPSDVERMYGCSLADMLALDDDELPDEWPGNYSAGIKWYLVAANNGHREAQHRLGIEYRDKFLMWAYGGPIGDHHERFCDPVEALRWLLISGVGMSDKDIMDLVQDMSDEEIVWGERLADVWKTKGGHYTSIERSMWRNWNLGERE